MASRFALLVAATLLLSCEAGPPRIEGVTTRVVGDTVTLRLVEGEANFAPGDKIARLVDSSAAVYTSDAEEAEKRIEVLEQDRKNVVAVLPSGSAPGTAMLYLQREGAEAEFEVPLTIDRVSLTLTSGGTMALVPLPPAQLAPQAFAEQPLKQISVSPDGRTVAFISGDEIGFADVGRATRDESSQQITRVKVANAKLVAALDDGAVVATNESVSVLKKTATGVDESKLQIANARALSAAESGNFAVVLFACPSGGSGPNDAACVVRIDLSSQEPSSGAAIVLEAPNTASLVAISRTGAQVAAPEGDQIHGVAFDKTPPQISKLTWSDGANPISVDRATATIDRERNDLFAVADAQGKRVRTFGFAEGILRFIQQGDATFEIAPGPLSFGRGIELYVSSGGKLYAVDLTAGSKPSVTDTGVEVPSDAITLQVQP